MSGNFDVGTGVRSGWVPAGAPRRVTRAQGNVVYEFDGEYWNDELKDYRFTLLHDWFSPWFDWKSKLNEKHDLAYQPGLEPGPGAAHGG